MGPATAVSRYHQQNRFFLINNSPNVSDHDFPNPGYLLNCSGYQQLVLKAEPNHADTVEEEYWSAELNDVIDPDEDLDEHVMETRSIRENFHIDKLSKLQGRI